MELPTVLIYHVLSFIVRDELPENDLFALYSDSPAPSVPPDIRTLVSVSSTCIQLRSSRRIKCLWERLLRRDFVGPNIPLFPSVPHGYLYGKMFTQLQQFVHNMQKLSSSRRYIPDEMKRRVRSPAVIDAWEVEHNVIVPFMCRIVLLLPANLPGVSYFNFDQILECPLKPPCKELSGGGGEYGHYWSSITTGTSWLELHYSSMSQYVDVVPSSKNFGHLTEIDDANPWGETRVEPKGEMMTWMTSYEFKSRFSFSSYIPPMSHDYSEYMDGMCETLQKTKSRYFNEDDLFYGESEDDSDENDETNEDD